MSDIWFSDALIKDAKAYGGLPLFPGAKRIVGFYLANGILAIRHRSPTEYPIAAYVGPSTPSPCRPSAATEE